MLNPIRVENTFQELLRELDHHASIRHRYSLIREFILQLDGHYHKYDSYLVQLAAELPLYSSPITYSGIDPKLVENDVLLFEHLSDVVEEISELDAYQMGIERLKQVALILYLLAGESTRFSVLMRRWFTIEINFETVSERPTGAHKEIYHQLMTVQKSLVNILESPELDASQSKTITAIIGDLKSMMEIRHRSVLIPVVEKYNTLNGKEVENGRIRRISVDVNDEINRKRDRIIRRFNVIGVEQPLWLEEDDVSIAARSLCTENEKELKDKRFNGEIHYELSGAIHEGNSAQAAISLLWYTGLQKYCGLKERYEIRSNITITGDVTKDGELYPVDKSSIRSKTMAAFFSWSSYLLVPKSQLGEFVQEAERLKQRYPNRNLKLLGIGHLSEIFFDRRLSIHINPSKVKYYFQKAWKNKFEAGGIISILILSLIIMRLVYGPLDKNPVLTEFSGEVLKVKNQMGTVLETIDVGERTVIRAENTSQSNLAEFADLTGNGMNEIIWGEINSEPRIVAKELNSENYLWEYFLDYDLMFPQKPFVMGNNYNPIKIRAGDFTGNGELDILVSANHTPYFPSILSLRNAKTGMEIVHFVNPGRIMDFDVVDITGDGQMEIIICGINNAYNSAFVAILNIDHLSGMAPATKEYELNGYSIVENISYVLLPKTIIGANIAQHTLYSIAERIRIISDGDLIQVYVRDFSQYRGVETQLPASQAYVQFFFNNDLSIRGIGTSDGYDLTADYLYREGIIDRLPDYLYFEEFKKELLYWNGEEFVGSLGD